MTDREQIRRDVDAELDPAKRDDAVDAATMARHCDALLAELEQAELERDAAIADMHRLVDKAENDRDIARRGMKALSSRMVRAEARLANKENA